MVLLALAWIAYFAIHTFLADFRVKNWAYALHPQLERWYRLLYNAWGGLSFLAVWAYQRTVPSQALWPAATIWDYLGGAMLLGGIVLTLLALRQYNLSEFAGTQQAQQDDVPDTLNTQGLNAYMRHPLYTAILLVIWGIFLQSGTDRSLLTASIWSLYIVFGTLSEEAKLKQVFGEEYRAYQRKVKRFVPYVL